MNEISVVLNQTPGKVSWNFEEVKGFLSKEMEYFKGMIYDDESIKTAKDDRAALNKLSKQIDAKKKEAKEKYLEPYQIIEEQARELKELIQGPVDAIDEQVKAYEERRKEAVKNEIAAYFDEKYKEVGLPDDIRKKVIMRAWDSRWLNATTSKKTWKTGVDSVIEQVRSEIEQLKDFRSDFEEDMMNTYRQNLSFQEATKTMNDLNRQRERVLENERRRIQEEEERKRREEERKRIAEEQQKRSLEEKKAAEERVEAETVEPEAKEDEPVYSKPDPDPIVVEPEEVELPTVVLKITADPMQIAKIKGYIKYVGADFVEVK